MIFSANDATCVLNCWAVHYQFRVGVGILFTDVVHCEKKYVSCIMSDIFRLGVHFYLFVINAVIYNIHVYFS